MIPTIRLHSQQLINPVFNNPKDLVSWMGGIQAQDYTMSKWAIGIRLKAGNLQTVNEALAKGDILRIHVMRPTWHYVCLLYTSPSPRDRTRSRMPSSA